MVHTQQGVQTGQISINITDGAERKHDHDNEGLERKRSARRTVRRRVPLVHHQGADGGISSRHHHQMARFPVWGRSGRM